jgi:hypothetical protein
VEKPILAEHTEELPYNELSSREMESLQRGGALCIKNVFKQRLDDFHKACYRMNPYVFI